jgi:hypothetical protein
MSATSQQNVMALYKCAALLQGLFPRRPAAVGVIVAAPSWSRQAERRMDDVQAQDAGADLRRSAWMAAAQAGDPPLWGWFLIVLRGHSMSGPTPVR